MNRFSKTKMLLGMVLSLVVISSLSVHSAFGVSVATNLACVTPSSTHTATLPTTGATADLQVTFTCSASVSNTPVPNQQIDGENTNAVNDSDGADETTARDFTCVTGGTGSCTITVPTTPTSPLAAGTGTYCFWIDSANDIKPPAGCSSETPSNTAGDDNIEVAQVTWVPRAPASLKILNPDDAIVLSPPTVMKQTIKVSVKDQFGSGFSGSDVDLFVIGGPNRGDSRTVTHACSSGADGSCTIDYTSNNNNGVDHVCVWLDSNAADSYAPGGAIDRGGSCIPLAHALAGSPLTDVGRVTWSGGASVPTDLVVTPKTTPGDSVAAGTLYSLTAKVNDEHGNAMPGQVVNFEIFGVADPNPSDAPGTIDRSCTTGANGACALAGDPGAQGSATTFTSSTGGLSFVRAWVNGQQIDTFEGVDPAVEPGLTIEPNTTEVSSVRFGRIETTLGTIISGPSTGTYGFSPVIAGTLVDDQTTPISGATVALYRRYIGGAWQLIDSATTSDQGAYSIRDQAPLGIADYQVQFAGDSSHLPSTGPAVRAWVRAASIFNVSRTDAAANHPVALSGRIVPAHPGKRVTLQWYQGNQGTWTNVKTVTLDQNSAFYFTFTRRGSGYLIFRIIYWKQDSLDLGNVSRILRVTWR